MITCSSGSIRSSVGCLCSAGLSGWHISALSCGERRLLCMLLDLVQRDVCNEVAPFGAFVRMWFGMYRLCIQHYKWHASPGSFNIVSQIAALFSFSSRAPLGALACDWWVGFVTGPVDRPYFGDQHLQDHRKNWLPHDRHDRSEGREGFVKGRRDGL